MRLTSYQKRKMVKEFTAVPKAAYRLARPATKTMVLIRHITTVTGGRAQWGDPRGVQTEKSPELNLKKAIDYARKYLTRTHMGTIVYVIGRGWREPVPVYEAKWGHDDLPYMAWKNSAIGLWWRRRIHP